MIRYRAVNINSPEIFRIFISGCSSAGKTYFAKKLIDSGFIKCKYIYYYHPDIHEQNPVDWNVVFQAGVPKLEDLLSLPEYSCVILDDLYHDCKDSKVVDYLFRVLSSKRKLHVIIMTQRYFSNGKFSLNIRNSCNFHVLMRNADELANLRAVRTMNLANEFKLAVDATSKDLYPYFLIDKTNHARVTGVQLYIDIFSQFPKVVMQSGLYYLISSNDFKKNFVEVDNQIAEYEPEKSKSSPTEVESGSDSIENSTITDSPDENEPDHATLSKDKVKQYYRERNKFRRSVEKVIRGYKKRPILQR